MKNLLIAATLFVSALSAADISGKWKGTTEGPNGTIERTFTFKQEGTKLTGETRSQILGVSPINDGKVEGDSVTFSVVGNFQGDEVKLVFRGKLIGEEIQMDAEIVGRDGPRLKYVAKRIQ